MRSCTVHIPSHSSPGALYQFQVDADSALHAAAQALTLHEQNLRDPRRKKPDRIAEDDVITVILPGKPTLLASDGSGQRFRYLVGRVREWGECARGY